MTRAAVRDRIVDAALKLAETRSWEAVRLHDVAAQLGITLDEVRRHFREKEEIVDAWFDRADSAMLQDAAKPDFLALGARERLQRLMLAWLKALAAHRRATRQMIYGKLEPGHVHYQVTGLLRVSRTVQWMREAAHRDATLPRRALEETALTTIYLMTFFYWMRDESPESVRTANRLERLLAGAQRLSHAFFDGARRRPARRPEATRTESATH